MEKIKNEDLGRLSIEEFKQVDKLSLSLLLDNVRSRHNVGSTFRTADAFRVEHVYLCGITARPPHRDIQKTALGATESVEWSYAETSQDILHRLKREGYQIGVIEQSTPKTFLQDFQPDTAQKYVLVFGNEVEGVSEETLALADFALEIPQFGTKHSLNISVSVGVVVWDFFSKMKTQIEPA